MIDYFVKNIDPIDGDIFDACRRIIETLARKVGLCETDLYWDNALLTPTSFDPSTWSIRIADNALERPELIYRQLRHVEQVFVMAQALIHKQLPMPEQFRTLVTDLSSNAAVLEDTFGISDFNHLVTVSAPLGTSVSDLHNLAALRIATGIPSKVLHMAQGKGPVNGPLDLTRNLFHSNFSLTRIQRSRRFGTIPRSASIGNQRVLAPGRVIASARESFQQPDVADLDRIERTVSLRLQQHRGVLALKRQQLANLVDHFRSNIVSFLEMKQRLETSHGLRTPDSPDLNFPTSLAMFMDRLPGGYLSLSPLSNPHTLTARIRHQIALMHACSAQLLLQWQQQNHAAPMPDSLLRMREMVHKLQVLTRELDLVSLEWFSMELPDVNDRNRFMFKYNDGHGVELRQDLGGPRPSRIRRPA